jgi:hypothetical protein
MGLVALGLMLICWRMLRGKSATWLINANALAAGLVLAGCSLVDIDAVAAQWNVDHAREVTGVGAPVDLAYLAARGDAALVPLSELERRLAPKELRASSPDLDTLAQIGCARDQAFANLAARQADWHGWSWRGARRLAQARALALPGVRFKC